MRTITVTGKGKIKVRPDMTRIFLTLEGVKKDYAETLRMSAEETELLKSSLLPFGFERTDLKTLSFDIQPEYESYQENGDYEQRFVGYRYEHEMKVEFLSDSEKLGKILYELSIGPCRPEIRLSYTISDPETAKNELLGKAVTDAKTKADVLGKAAGITLKDIQNIDYTWGEISFEVNPMVRKFAMGADMEAKINSFDMNIDPDDVLVTDTVTVMWEIG